MTGKIFRSCLAMCVAVIVLCTGLFVAVMTERNEKEIYLQHPLGEDHVLRPPSGRRYGAAGVL